MHSLFSPFRDPLTELDTVEFFFFFFPARFSLKEGGIPRDLPQQETLAFFGLAVKLLTWKSRPFLLHCFSNRFGLA